MGGPTPRELVFYKGKMYWLYLDRDYEEYHFFIGAIWF
jgi:hypothetical protein